MSKEVILTVKADTKEAQSNVKDLNKDLNKTKGDLSGIENIADKATGGLISGFKGVTSTIGGVVKGFKTMRMAIIATGIGALVLVISSLTAAFTSSEEGANKFNKILGVLGAVVDNFIDLLADLGEGLISAFENPKEALMSFVNLLKNQVVNRITGLMELIPQLGKAVQLVFEGEFSEAGKVATNAVGKIALGVEDVTGKIQAATKATKEFIEENIKDAEGAARVADMRAKANKLERELLVERSKLESEIANLRLKSRQEEEFGAAERKQALLDAQKLEDQLLQKETEVLKLRRDAQVEENTFARSSIENLDKEAQAIAAVNRIAATRANQQRTTQRELNTLNKQIAAENKRIANEKKKLDEEEAKRNQSKIEAEKKRIEKLKQEQSKADNEEAIRAEQQYNLLQKLRNTAEEQELFELQQQFDAKMLLAEGNNELELALTDKFFKDSEAIEKKYNQQRVDENKKTNDKIAENEQRLQDLKTDAVLSGLNTISSLVDTFAGESVEQQKKAFNINKAVGIASTLVQTFQSAQGAYLSQLSIPTPDAPIRANIAAGIATATGLANVAAIAAQKFKAPSKQTPSSSGGGVGGDLTSPTQAPSFNVVGQSGFNQIAGALGQQEPVQAFVVAGDVTTAQELQNNTIQQATF